MQKKQRQVYGGGPPRFTIKALLGGKSQVAAAGADEAGHTMEVALRGERAAPSGPRSVRFEK